LLSDHNEEIKSCTWALNDDVLISAGIDKKLSMWKENKLIHSWTGSVFLDVVSS